MARLCFIICAVATFAAAIHYFTVTVDNIGVDGASNIDGSKIIKLEITLSAASVGAWDSSTIIGKDAARTLE